MGTLYKFAKSEIWTIRTQTKQRKHGIKYHIPYHLAHAQQ